MKQHDFIEGDRVRYVGPPEPGSGHPPLDIPDLMPGEQGWIIDVDEAAFIVAWDRHGTIDMGSPADLERGSNETDPMKRSPAS